MIMSGHTRSNVHDKDTVFLINLLQDVNIVRGLVYLAARETDTNIRFLVTRGFINRDTLGIWQKQIVRISADVGATIHLFDDPLDAFAILQGRGGLIIAASESSLSGHAPTHNVFRIAPPSFLKITLQHGFEGVGFLQSREHILAHGRNIGSAADILCGWSLPGALNAMTAAMRPRLYVTGPPTLLQVSQPDPDHPPVDGGLICENLHSVRLSATGNHRAAFMDIFFDFCADLQGRNRNVTLRPHPGGQYVLKNSVPLPANVTLNNLPIYHVNLAGYAYGISAPSTIVLDMVLAGIPVGLWRDPDGVMDAGNYDGLTEISGLQDWRAFERDATLRPGMILERQRRFLDRVNMIIDPAEVYRRFARLLVNGSLMLPQGTRADSPAVVQPSGPNLSGPVPSAAPVMADAANNCPRRILFIVNGDIPTLQLSFIEPLRPFVTRGALSFDILTEEQLHDTFHGDRFSTEAKAWFRNRLETARPDLIICCRYSGSHEQIIRDYATAQGIALIYHVDDDLLNIPIELGEKKYLAHNTPRKLATVRYLLENADLVYCSTPALKRRFRGLGFRTPMAVGQVYCVSQIRRHPTTGPVRRIGYMGFDHAHDFEIALPALTEYLTRNPAVEFELFGTIPMPESLNVFGSRVTSVPPVRDYRQFLQALAARNWDIGICPLARTPFNSVKANTKWVEYTAAGMAVIATRGMVYDGCMGQGRGLLVDDGDWFEALQLLTDRPALRHQIAVAAQAHLLTDYSETMLRDQVLDVFRQAGAILAGRPQPSRPLAPFGLPALPDADGLLQTVQGVVR